jgi:hypothetical protein
LRDYSATMKASRGVLLVALGILAIAALRDFARLGDGLPWRQLYDFADFYCAGAAIDAGADPYRYEPLHRCEHTVNQSAAFRADPARVVPAPQPPYDFPPFMLLAHLRFSTARAIAAAAILCTVVACVWGLALLGIPPELAAVAFALPAGYLLLDAGQVVPFALVALVFCGVMLARRHDSIAGVLAALTLIEPHLGLPVCAAVVAWRPATRLAFLAACAVLAGIALWTVGAGAAAEYALRVLPAHAAAEIGYVYQYSLTYLLRNLGVPPSASLRAGELFYGAMLFFGVWLASRVAKLLGRAELLAYLPGACAVLGGAFVHQVDLALAIPAALVLATNLQGRSKTIATVALCLLAVPWIPVWITKKLFLATLFVVAAILVRLRTATPVAITSFAAIALAIYLLELAPPAPLVAATVGAFSPNDLAQRAWRAYIGELSNPNLGWLAVKVPSWLALAALPFASLRALREQRVSIPQ